MQVDQIGLDPIDTGSLKDSWRQQPGTPVYGADWNKEVLPGKLLEADRSISEKKSQQTLVLLVKAMEEFNKETGKELNFGNTFSEGGAEFNDKFVNFIVHCINNK